jgi:hypothetical protein
MRLPSCSRCTIRKISCEYASTTGSQEEKKPAGESENLSDTSDQTTLALENSSADERNVSNHPHSSLHTELPVDNAQVTIMSLSCDRTAENMAGSSLGPPHGEVSGSARRDGSVTSSTAQSSDISSSHITEEELARTWVNIDNVQHFLDSDPVLEIPLAETSTMALSPGYQLSNAQSPFQVNDTTCLFEGFDTQWLSASLANFQSPSEHDWGNCVTNFSMEPSSDFSFNLMGSFGIPGSHTTSNTFQKVSTDCPGSSFDAPSWKPPLRPETLAYSDKVSEDELSLVVLNGPSRITPADTINTGKDAQDRDLQVPTFDQASDLTSCPVNGLSYQMNSNKDLAKILLEYPQMMARPGGKYPPFVHHKLYRCEEGDVLKPLAVAFCFVAALNAAFPSGKGFVHSLMNAEMDRLLKGFRLLRDSELDMMATVHAICVYQIMGFFDDSSPDSARFAELQQPFFLRMARRLIAAYMPQLRSSYDASDYSEPVWEKWISAETIRRTFFLIHIINVIACRTEKQNAYFYEELDDDLVMNLPLPAPEKVWKASSAAEWKSALEEELQGGWQTNRTASINFGGNGWKEGNANGNGWDPSGDSMISGVRTAGKSFQEIHLTNSHEFTRLLMHCIDRRNRG